MKEKTKTFWGLNDENFTHDSLSDLIDDNSLNFGDKVYSCKATLPKGSDYFDVDELLNRIEENAFDNDLEEEEENIFDSVTPSEKETLNQYIKDWLDNHACFKNYKKCESPREHILTKELFSLHK